MTCELLPMGRIAKVSTRKGNGAARPAEPGAGRELDLTALRQTPGFMIRILQLQNPDHESRGLLERAEIELPPPVRLGRLCGPVTPARRRFADSAHGQ